MNKMNEKNKKRNVIARSAQVRTSSDLRICSSPCKQGDRGDKIYPNPCAGFKFKNNLIGRSLEFFRFLRKNRDDIIYFKAASIAFGAASQAPCLGSCVASPRMTFTVLTLSTLLSFSIISDSWACNGNDVECGQNCCAEITEGTDTKHARIYAAGSGDITIGAEAFVSQGFTSVDIPEGVTVIEPAAFAGNQLTSVTIPNSVTQILDDAFAENRLTSVSIPNSVQSIEGGAFMGNQIETVSLGNSLQSIGASAFINNQITSVTIPDSVELIAGSAFENNPTTSVSVGSGYTGTLEELAHSFYNAPITSLQVASVAEGSSVPSGFSQNFPELTSFNIPSGVTSIENDALRDYALQSVTIPDSVTSIGSGAFVYTQLESIIIPDSVTSIGYYAFAGNEQLTSVVIGNGVTEILDQAFESTPNLTSVTIGNSVEFIGDAAFAGSGLTSIIIPDSVKDIRPGAFADNPNLTSVTLPEGLENISEYAFIDCPNLSTITCVDKGKGGCDNIREQLREYGYEGDFKVEFIQPEWNQKHYTPAEAAKWLKDENNTITITFKK